MIPRKNLISLKEEFARLRKNGKMYDSPSFGLLVSYSHSPTEEHVAFIVSKKVSLKSTERHAVKRKLADAVKPILPCLPQNTQLVFLAKQQAVGKTTEMLAVELEKALTRARVLS